MTSYRLSIVTMSQSAAVWPQFLRCAWRAPVPKLLACLFVYLFFCLSFCVCLDLSISVYLSESVSVCLESVLFESWFVVNNSEGSDSHCTSSRGT